MKPIMYIFFGILINEIFYVFMHGFPFKKKKSIPKLDLDLEKNTYVLSWGVSSDVQLYYYKKKLAARHEVSISIVDIEECGAFFQLFQAESKGWRHPGIPIVIIDLVFYSRSGSPQGTYPVPPLTKLFILSFFSLFLLSDAGMKILDSWQS